VSRSSRGGQTGAGSSGSLGAAISEDLSGNHASRARESCARPSENGASENQKLLNGQDPFDRGEDVDTEVDDADDVQGAALADAAAWRNGLPGDVAPSAFDAHPIPASKRYYAVTMFCLIAALLYADQNLLAPTLSLIAKDFGFNDVEKDQYLGGWIAAAFFLAGAPAAVVMGWVGGSHNRCNLVLWVVIAGKAPSAATYFVTQYWQLLILRLLTGISLGGIFPLIFSLLGDLFSVHQRAFVAALVQVAIFGGMSLGQLIAGLIGPAWGWRSPFVVVAIPTLILAVVVWFTVPEPERGITEAALQGEDVKYEEEMDWDKTKKLVKIRTNVFMIMQGLPGSLPWGMSWAFLNDYLDRQKGFSVPDATLAAAMVGIGGAVGVLIGGAIGQKLYTKRRRLMPLFAAVCVVLSVPSMMYVVNAPLKGPGSVELATFLVFCAGFTGSVCSAPIRAMIMNVNEPETRGVALALHVVLDDLGRGAGPGLVALLITWMGRQAAFSLSILGWIPCGLCIFGAYFTLERDEDAMQMRLVATSQRAASSRAMSLDASERGAAAALLPPSAYRSYGERSSPGGASPSSDPGSDAASDAGSSGSPRGASTRSKSRLYR